MQKKQLKLEDLEPQYRQFCENVKKVKQNTYWGVLFHSLPKENYKNEKEKKDQ